MLINGGYSGRVDYLVSSINYLVRVVGLLLSVLVVHIPGSIYIPVGMVSYVYIVTSSKGIAYPRKVG